MPRTGAVGIDAPPGSALSCSRAALHGCPSSPHRGGLRREADHLQLQRAHRHHETAGTAWSERSGLRRPGHLAGCCWRLSTARLSRQPRRPSLLLPLADYLATQYQRPGRLKPLTRPTSLPTQPNGARNRPVRRPGRAPGRFHDGGGPPPPRSARPRGCRPRRRPRRPAAAPSPSLARPGSPFRSPPAPPAPQIKRAYRNLATKAHPDKGGDPDAFRALVQAYEVLSDEGKRREYDATGRVVRTAEEEFMDG